MIRWLSNIIERVLTGQGYVIPIEHHKRGWFEYTVFIGIPLAAMIYSFYNLNSVSMFLFYFNAASLIMRYMLIRRKRNNVLYKHRAEADKPVIERRIHPLFSEQTTVLGFILLFALLRIASLIWPVKIPTLSILHFSSFIFIILSFFINVYEAMKVLYSVELEIDQTPNH